MEIKKFSASQQSGKDKIYHKYGKRIYQRILDSFNSEGYKLYYYRDFNLIEIISLKKLNWNIWGNDIFFLNESEYQIAMNTINKSKELYDKYLEQAETISKLPLSTIVHEILKIE